MVSTSTGAPIVSAMPTAAPQLGLIGRILILALTLPGVMVGAASGLGLLWFVPYSGTGALLAIRRPRTSIGWLLLVLGWALALAGLATLDTGQAATPPPLPDWLFSILSASIWPLVFGLFVLLAVVLPSGHLPPGRWRVAAIAAIAISVGSVIATLIVPAATDFLIGPMLAVLVVAAASLLVRRWRATGVERQQLRWIVASIIVVIAGFAVGVAVGTLVPGTDESGLAWMPVAIAFPLVPIAIGIAVLRYRLYEIDTIINRTIVYGLLTAVLAGGSSAVVGVTQKLFVGVIGPGSDASIVLTTLIVVAAFNPVKERLQAFVDRRYKPAGDPAAALKGFVTELHASPSPLALDRTLRRFLEVAIDAFDARGGRIEIRRGDQVAVATSTGERTGAAMLRADASGANGDATVELNAGHFGRGSEALQPALAAVLAELADEGSGEAAAVVAPVTVGRERALPDSPLAEGAPAPELRGSTALVR